MLVSWIFIFSMQMNFDMRRSIADYFYLLSQHLNPLIHFYCRHQASRFFLFVTFQPIKWIWIVSFISILVDPISRVKQKTFNSSPFDDFNDEQDFRAKSFSTRLVLHFSSFMMIHFKVYELKIAILCSSWRQSARKASNKTRKYFS